MVPKSIINPPNTSSARPPRPGGSGGKSRLSNIELYLANTLRTAANWIDGECLIKDDKVMNQASETLWSTLTVEQQNEMERLVDSIKRAKNLFCRS